ncbi:MAG: hypothetical protein JWN61_329 [Pseudonocardiales bacterium]|nr:hypothetical protein [Pseudonocardiales bacterium]
MIAETSTPTAPVARARRASRFAALAGAAVLVTGMLAGCGAGQISETAVQHPTVGGSNADLGEIALRNMQIQAPEAGSWATGDTVALTLTIVNNSDSPEDLTGITTEAAQKVLIFADGAEYLSYLASQTTAATTAAATPTAAAPGAPSASPSNSGVSAAPSPTTAGATQTPTGSKSNPNQTVDPSATSGSSTSAAPSGSLSSSAPVKVSPTGSVTLPSNQAVQFGYGSTNRPVILLIGLTEPIGGGSAPVLTFTFSTAGTVSAAVPVSLTKNGADDSPTLNLHHEGGMGDENAGEH